MMQFIARLLEQKTDNLYSDVSETRKSELRIIQNLNLKISVGI